MSDLKIFTSIPDNLKSVNEFVASKTMNLTNADFNMSSSNAQVFKCEYTTSKTDFTTETNWDGSNTNVMYYGLKNLESANLLSLYSQYVNVFSINKDLYGKRITPGSVSISRPGGFDFIDDGKGQLIWSNVNTDAFATGSIVYLGFNSEFDVNYKQDLYSSQNINIVTGSYLGTAAEFNGSTSALVIGNDKFNHDTFKNDFSISFWLKHHPVQDTINPTLIRYASFYNWAVNGSPTALNIGIPPNTPPYAMQIKYGFTETLNIVSSAVGDGVYDYIGPMSPGNTYIYSIFIKNNSITSGTPLMHFGSDLGGESHYISVDTITGVITIIDPTVITFAQALILEDGWIHVSFRYVPIISGTYQFIIYNGNGNVRHDFTVAKPKCEIYSELTAYTPIITKRSVHDNMTANNLLSAYPFDIKISNYTAGQDAPLNSLIFSKSDGVTTNTIILNANDFPDLSDDNWHNVIITSYGTSQQIYIDEIPLSGDYGNALNVIINNSDIYVGSYGYSKNIMPIMPYKGIIDEIRFYNKSLSSTEITSLNADILQTNVVGQVIYEMGLVIYQPQNKSLYDYLDGTNYFTYTFDTEVLIRENQINCYVLANDYMNSMNPSLYDSNGNMLSFATSSLFTPYITSIGLYNKDYELVAVAKMASPIPKLKQANMNFLIKFDTN